MHLTERDAIEGTYFQGLPESRDGRKSAKSENGWRNFPGDEPAVAADPSTKISRNARTVRVPNGFP